MVALKASEVESFLARPNRPIVLIFGPDAGLVRERAEALVRKSVDDPKDPFQLARMDGDELSSEPARLLEEANTVPLFGGRRAVWIKAGARNFAPALEALVAAPPPNCRIVIEAGDLKRNAPLRAVCERAKNAAVLPCYPDAAKDLTRLIDEEMGEAGLAISGEARAALIPLLGGDRLASRHEIRKVALFARGKRRVGLEDVAAVVADASTLALDDLIDAAFAGRTGDVDVQFDKARTSGTTPGAILSAALRHVAQLHKARLSVDQGDSISQAVEGIQPFVRFNRKSVVETALRAWTSVRLQRAMARLGEAALDARRQSAMAEPIARGALLTLALDARRKQ
ncbi:MAG TPA: DNA polymerase III subunit delta [Xanthobacteraceae bacterium]|nr:DNA polymerase III subunit delta [Xanthobacteraceae bacterium]